MKLLFSSFLLANLIASSSSAVVTDSVDAAKDDAAQTNNLRGLQSNNKPDKIKVLVTLKGNSGIANQCNGKAKKHGGSVKAVFKTVMSGCTLEIPPAAMNALRQDADVKLVEEDQQVTAFGCAPAHDHSSCTVPSNEVTWGLNRMDQCGPLDGTTLPYVKRPAYGARLYILDTGIRMSHQEFDGMHGPSSCSQDFTGEFFYSSMFISHIH